MDNNPTPTANASPNGAYSANTAKPADAANASVTTTTTRKSRVSRSRSYSIGAVPESTDRPYVAGSRSSARADVTDPLDNSSSNTSASVTTTTTASTSDIAVLTTTSSVCFATVEEVTTESYPSARADAIGDAQYRGDDFEGAKIPRPDTAMSSSMAPPATVTVTTTERKVVPCTTSGERHGIAAGAFLNDAQIVHAALLANTIDSAVSAAALTRTQNPLVRDYANMMVRDHTAGNQKLAALIDRLHIAPAQNDISNQMLGDVKALSETVANPAITVGVTKPDAPAASVTVTTRTTTTATPSTDTLHLSNPFVAAANMQPWSSLLAGTTGSASGSVNATTTVETKTAVTTTTTTDAVAIPISDFDRQYANYQVEFHQKVLDALDARLIPWAGPEERAALEEARPTVAAHLEAARNLQRQLNPRY